MGLGPVGAVGKLFARTKVSFGDLALVELNEAFAAQVLSVRSAWEWEDFDRLNVNGSGISLGHPIGATGARITTTLLHELRRRGGGLGLVTMCVGGGQGMAALFEIPGARVQLETAADQGEEVGDLVGAASALHGLARLGRVRQVAARLAALADDVDGDLVAARAAYANALAARNSAALNKVSGDFEGMGAILYAAEASAEAAVTLRRAGNARIAAAAEQKAARLLARCEGATTSPVGTITARVRLTPGELDVTLRAASGRSNKQIASDMSLGSNRRKPSPMGLREARGLGAPRAG
jgi:DNA-binding CsgD family transcriptional regulator